MCLNCEEFFLHLKPDNNSLSSIKSKDKFNPKLDVTMNDSKILIDKNCLKMVLVIRLANSNSPVDNYTLPCVKSIVYAVTNYYKSHLSTTLILIWELVSYLLQNHGQNIIIYGVDYKIQPNLYEMI